MLSPFGNRIWKDMDIPKARNEAYGQQDKNYPRNDIGETINQIWG
jgi:hypothetical protein